MNRNSNYANIYPLSGLVICSHCGKPMNRHYYSYGKPSQRVVLSCKNRYRDKKTCDNLPTDNTTLELAVTESIKKLELFKESTLKDALNLVESSLSNKELENKITELKNNIKSIESDLRDIIKMNVSNIEDSEFHKEIYKEKKEMLSHLREELNEQNKLLVNRHINKQRMTQINDFLKGYIPINKEILGSVYKMIISLTREDYLFLICDTKLDKKKVLYNLETIKLKEPLLVDSIISKDNKHTINYKVIKLERD